MDTGEWGDLLQTFPLTSVHLVKRQSLASFSAGVRGAAIYCHPGKTNFGRSPSPFFLPHSIISINFLVSSRFHLMPFRCLRSSKPSSPLESLSWAMLPPLTPLPSLPSTATTSSSTQWRACSTT